MFGKKTPAKPTINAKRISEILATMKPLPTEEPFKIPKFPYKKIEGSFGIMTRTGVGTDKEKITNVTWEGCRDRFQNSSAPEAVMDFLFYHQAGTADNVIDFLRMVEEIVKLKPEDRLEFHKTTHENVLYVKMSPWWKYTVRRSLLTALLRCGQAYAERTAKAFEKALFSQYYLAQTKPAVSAFLHGRTASKLKKRARQGFQGWYAHFQNKNEDAVKATLTRILPDDHPKKPKPPEPKPEEGQGGEGQVEGGATPAEATTNATSVS